MLALYSRLLSALYQWLGVSFSVDLVFGELFSLVLGLYVCVTLGIGIGKLR